MRYIKHLSADQNLQRLTFLSSLAMAKPMADFSNWLITGAATIIGAILVNVDNVSKILTVCSLRWGLTLLVVSMLFGIVIKQFGFAIEKGITMLEDLHSEMATTEGQFMLENLTLTTEEMQSAISEPYIGPLNKIISKSFSSGTKDYLSAEKRFIKLLCIQIYGSYLQGIFGAIGLLILAFGISQSA